MASHHNKTIALTFLVSIILAACNTSPIKSHNNSDDLDNASNILNVLDPDISTEQQALTKAQAALQEGKNDNALFYFVKTLQFNKNNIHALEQIALIHERGKHPEFAIKVYQDILVIDAKNALANEKLGLYYLNRGQDGKAKQFLSQAVKTDARKWKSYNGLGVIADLEQNTAEAINYYQVALAIEPSNPMLLNNLGYSYYLKGDELKARDLFKQALNLDTQYKRAIQNLALIEIKNGDFTSAAMLFNRIMSPHETYNNIGYIAMLNGQYDTAEEYLRRAIDESPVYFPKAQENLKNLLAQKLSRTPYQPTFEERLQTEPTPEVQIETEGSEEPTVNVKPELNAKKIAQAEKEGLSQRSKPIVNYPANKKAANKEESKNKMIKAQQIAARPVKKKTQPEIKKVTDSKSPLSDATKPVDLSDRAPAPVLPKPSTASAQEKENPANKAQKPALPDHDQALHKPEDSKTETPQSLHAAQPQTVENNLHGVIAEHSIPSPQEPVANPNSKESAQPPAVRVAEEQKKAVELPPQPDSLSSSAVSVKTAAPGPVQPMTEGKQPASGNLQTANTGQPAANPKSELPPPSAPSSFEPVKKQGIQVPQKFEAPTPLTPLYPLKKNDAFVTDIVVDK
jgi:Flp pilus assembly protein TadD